MQIEILSVQVEDKGKYKMAEVAYKSDGKISSKKLMSFGGGAEAFKVITNASPGSSYSIRMVKNDKGYWDWVEAVPAGQATSSGGTASMASAPAPRSNYETAEERATRQVLIVRQSSLSSAIEFSKLNSKKVPSTQEIIQIAREFEAFVFGKSTDPVAGIGEMSDDIPY
jgi:hypothetical protein